MTKAKKKRQRQTKKKVIIRRHMNKWIKRRDGRNTHYRLGGDAGEVWESESRESDREKDRKAETRVN